MKLVDRIVWEPTICHGKPTIRGTRVLVSVVAANLADGLTDEEILYEYPTLTAEDIRAVIQFLAELSLDDIAYSPGMFARAN